jgi:hypothetical protein
MRLFFLVFVLSLNALAVDGEVCSKQTSVCVRFSSDREFSTESEGQFRLFLTASEGVVVNLHKIDLWMQMGDHGHGSSPLQVMPLGPFEYDITKAYFVMRGSWQIRIAYSLGGVTERLIIPVMIKE